MVEYNNIINFIGKSFYFFPIFSYYSQGTTSYLPSDIYVTSNIYVCQGKYIISDKHKKLSTSGLCTCVAFLFPNKKFMIYIDANTNINKALTEINKTLTEQNITSKDINNINIWKGTFYGNYYTFNKEISLLKSLKIDIYNKKNIINIKNVCFMESVSL